jgi:FkbM family methyltransferase
MVDVGCNHGLASLSVAALGHTILCFEPVSSNVQKLRQSRVFSSHPENYIIFHGALGNMDKEIEVPIFVKTTYTHITTI